MADVKSGGREGYVLTIRDANSYFLFFCDCVISFPRGSLIIIFSS